MLDLFLKHRLAISIIVLLFSVPTVFTKIGATIRHYLLEARSVLVSFVNGD